MELREWVASCYREAQPLPDRPALDALLEGIGLLLQWSAEARDGQGAYVARGSDASDSERTPSLQRARTITSPLSRKQLSEEVAEALRLEEKLRYAEKQGSFLVLAVPPRHLQRAEQELTNRFQVEPVDGDAGTPRGPHGLWMIIPSHGPGTLPKLNGKAIPITNDAQFEVLNGAWIANRHRGTN